VYILPRLWIYSQVVCYDPISISSRMAQYSCSYHWLCSSPWRHMGEQLEHWHQHQLDTWPSPYPRRFIFEALTSAPVGHLTISIPPPLYLRGNGFRHLLNRKLHRTKSSIAALKRKKSLSMRGIEPRFLGHAIRSLVTVSPQSNTWTVCGTQYRPTH
jgi:hypothetical protein